MQELEAKNAVERKQLMQSLFDCLSNAGIEAELIPEPAINPVGISVMESVIRLKDQNLNKIRLVGSDGSGCGISGNILRFQYEVSLDNKLSPEQMKNMNAATKIVKEGKIMNYFGGKVTGVKWAGQKLAETLNEDPSIAADLLKCVKSWSHLEFQIEADGASQVNIIGPRFSNPGMIAELYKSDIKEEIRCCVFGYDTQEKIARHIKSSNL